MMTSTHFLSYSAQCFSKWEMFQTNITEKIKTRSLCLIPFFFQKSCHLWDDVEKYCRARKATMTIWHTGIACWIPKTTNTHSEYVMLVAFPLLQWLHKCALCYIIRTLPVSFCFLSSLPPPTPFAHSPSPSLSCCTLSHHGMLCDLR